MLAHIITYLFAMYIHTSFLVQFWGLFCLRTLSIVVIFPLKVLPFPAQLRNAGPS